MSGYYASLNKFELVEDQVMFRSLLRRLLFEECRGTVMFEAGSLEELHANVERLKWVDLLVLDNRLSDGDAVDSVDEMLWQALEEERRLSA